MTWLREVLSDPKYHQLSSNRLAMLIATFALALSVVILSIAALFGYEVALALGAMSVPLAGLGGYSYVEGSRVHKITTNNKEE